MITEAHLSEWDKTIIVAVLPSKTVLTPVPKVMPGEKVGYQLTRMIHFLMTTNANRTIDEA